MPENVVSLFGIAGGVVTILVFLTGKPSIAHFLPVRLTRLTRLTRVLPLPATRWKFLVKENTLYLRSGPGPVPVLPELGSVKDYRVLASPRRSRFLVIYRRWHKERFDRLLLVNSDGTKLEEHEYPSGAIDALWISENSYAIYLMPDHFGEFLMSDGIGYPHSWRNLGGDQQWEGIIVPSNYLVQVNGQNRISKVSRY